MRSPPKIGAAFLKSLGFTATRHTPYSDSCSENLPSANEEPALLRFETTLSDTLV
jgi:hypothetical protein